MADTPALQPTPTPQTMWLVENLPAPLHPVNCKLDFGWAGTGRWLIVVSWIPSIKRGEKGPANLGMGNPCIR